MSNIQCGQKEDMNYFARRFADYGFAAFSEETFEKYLPEILSFVMENHRD